MMNPGNWTVEPGGLTVISDHPTPGTVICVCERPQDAVAIAALPEVVTLLREWNPGKAHRLEEARERVVNRIDGIGLTQMVGGPASVPRG